MGSISSTQKQVEKILKKYPLKNKIIVKISKLIETVDENFFIKLFKISLNPEKVLFIYYRISHLLDRKIMICNCLEEILLPKSPLTLSAAIFYMTKYDPVRIINLNLTESIKHLNYIEQYTLLEIKSGINYKTSISYILQGLINGLINSSYHAHERINIINAVLKKIDVEDIHFSGYLEENCIMLELNDYERFFIDDIFKSRKFVPLKSFKIE